MLQDYRSDQTLPIMNQKSKIIVALKILDTPLKNSDGVSFWAVNNLLTTTVPHHRETSQLICNANQLTGFYMMQNIDR